LPELKGFRAAPFIILVSDVKRIQSLLGRLSSACERLEVLPRARAELLPVDETGLELCLLWLEMLEASRHSGDLRPFLSAVAESIVAEMVVGLILTADGPTNISGDLELAFGQATGQKRVSALLDDLCDRRFTTNLDHAAVAEIIPSTDIIAFLSVPLLGPTGGSMGMLLATRRKYCAARRSFNERERLALTVAATALGLSLRQDYAL
jgi:hypothetical protein